MSQLNVDTIKKADGTGNLSVPAETGTVVTTASPSLGRRNLIINGSAAVNQRGDSTGVTSNGYYACDRFRSLISGLGTWSISQSTDAPDGFGSSLKWDCTTADASPSASDYAYIMYRIEGQDLQHLKFGTSDAQSLTLSFWVKCNKTGTGRLHFSEPDSSYRSIGSSYTIDTADTWEHKTVTIVGDTSGTINNDNGVGFEVMWWLDSGTDYSSGAMPTAWEAESNPDKNAGGTLALGDSTDNEFYITGVQLEVGSVASTYEHISYGEELALCQRYFFGPVGKGLFGVGRTTNASTMWSIQYPVQMRANPTPYLTSTTLTIAEPNQANFNITSATIAAAYMGKTSSAFYVNGTMTVSVGDNLFLTDDYLEFDTEL